MSIQSSINQVISLASLLYSQTPHVKGQGEKAVLNVREKKIQEQREEEAAAREANFQAQYEHALETNIKPDPTDAGKEVEQQAFEELAKAAKQRYLANPTDATYQDWKDFGTGAIEGREQLTTERTQRMAAAKKSAQANLESEQQRIAASRRITEGIYYSPESEKSIAEQQTIRKGGAK